MKQLVKKLEKEVQRLRNLLQKQIDTNNKIRKEDIERQKQNKILKSHIKNLLKYYETKKLDKKEEHIVEMMKKVLD